MLLRFLLVLSLLSASCASDGDVSGGDASSDGGGSDGPTFADVTTTTTACAAANTAHASVGCDYWATFMDTFKTNGCFAAFVANTWTTPVHIGVEWDGKALPVDAFTRVPSGSGASLTYAPFDSGAGLPPGQVAILFLSGPTGATSALQAPCPVPSAVPSGVLVLDSMGVGTTGIGRSFHITTDAPVVAYEINPYGGGSAAVTGASLLLPTSVWDTNYVAVNAYKNGTGKPSLNIVAEENGTHVTMLPVADVEGGNGIPSGPAHVPLTFTLDRGQHAQLSQSAELTGSIVQSDRPVGVMAGHQCMYIPEGVGACDHGEQMLPPVKALGSEYVGVMYAPRTTEPAIWRLIGAVDGTALTWSSDVGGPATLSRGQSVEFVTDTPFVVKSQDAAHPFVLFEHMSGSAWNYMTYAMLYVGDPDSVLAVPPAQFMNDYVFFADPTYPITNLVVIRAKKDGAFADVTLDCAGTLGGWQPIAGDDRYEWTRPFLNQGNFQPVGACDTGRHEMKSDAPFGLTVWGWGTPATGGFDGGVLTQSVSYAYPAGMSVAPINPVVIAPN